MNRVETQLVFGRAIRTKLVGHHDRWSDARLLQEFAHQPCCGPGIAATSHQESEHLTFAVDGAPKIKLLTSDHDEHFIKEPVIGWLVTVLPKAPSVDTTEMQEPSTCRLVGDIQSAFRQKLLNVAEV